MLEKKGFCSGARPAGAVPSPVEAFEDRRRLMDADIVIVGAGASGLCAAVQASANGGRVLVLEVNGFIGGNGLMTEGMFACGSDMQKAAGIDISFKDLFAKEASFFNYRIDATFWKDMYDHSAENLQWLMDNGVPFSGVVDRYNAFGHIPAFHWFSGKRGHGFSKALHDKAVEQGAQFLLNTRGRRLIMEGGRVAGIVADRKDGSTLEIRCGAVILASGGYPLAYEKGKEITGLTEGQLDAADVTVYHAGTAIKEGKLVTNGGRVLGVTATGDTLGQAVERAYAAVDRVKFQNAFCRRDIGQKALQRKGRS